MNSLSLINSRDLGIFPISMATSLAIEALANLTPDRDPVLPMGITKIDTLLVNVRTLIRNIESAFKNDDVKKLSVDDILETVSLEMANIVTAIKEIAPANVKVDFYVCTYEGLSKFKTANLVVPTTPGKMIRAAKTNLVIEKLIQKAKVDGRSLRVYDLYPFASDFANDRVAMLTHMPMDLLEHRRFHECLLLESNTGRLKHSSEFHTKLHKRVDGLKLPFNLFTLLVFGDGKVFKPMNSAIVQEVIDVAIRGKWTSMTTPDKLRFWVGRIKLHAYVPDLLSLIKD